MLTEKDLIEILKSEVVPAMGCTEPVAVALACAAAAGGKKEIQDIEVLVSPNIYKNGMSVGIPGIKEVGLEAAAAIGAVGGDYTLGLEVLTKATNEDMELYYEVLKKKLVKVRVSDNGENLYVEARVATFSGEGRCIIRGSHSNIVYLQLNGEVKINKEVSNTSCVPLREKLMEVRICDLINLVENVSYKDIEFLLDGARMNKEAAEFGLKERPGMAIGASMFDYIEKGILVSDIYHTAQAYTAAACDTRMAGYFIPVMSSAGSGNHGLTAILPVVAAGEKIEANNVQIARALTISHIVTIYIKNYTGRLSALCGCGVAAATGASVAIAYLLGAEIHQIEGTIKNMIADLSGMICDGAKPGCSLKLSTAAGVAVKSALLALNGSVVPSDNGIVGDTCEKTIQNLGRVSSPGMMETDRVILGVMIDKNICR